GWSIPPTQHGSREHVGQGSCDGTRDEHEGELRQSEAEGFRTRTRKMLARGYAPSDFEISEFGISGSPGSKRESSRRGSSERGARAGHTSRGGKARRIRSPSMSRLSSEQAASKEARWLVSRSRPSRRH